MDYLKPASFRLVRILVIVCGLVLSQTSAASTELSTFDLSESVFDSTVVDPYLLYSVALVESGWTPEKGAVHYGPWPYSVRVNSDHPVFGGGHRFDTAANALEFVNRYFEDGQDIRQLDLGMMQISYRYHSGLIDHHGGIAAMFDPATNLKVGAEILRVAMNSTKDPVLGVGRYHGWVDIAGSRDYAKSVFRIYERLMLLRTSL